MVTILDAGPAAGVPCAPWGRPAVGLSVRQACARDRAALEAMFLRCSRETVYRRFHGHVRAFPQGYLRGALAGDAGHYALVTCDAACVVALGSCRTMSSGAAELGILVEDAWQRRGVGGVLLRRMIEHADALGLDVLRAQVLSEQNWIIGLLARYGRCSLAFRPGVREVTLHRDRKAP